MATKHNLVIEQGTTFAYEFAVKDSAAAAIDLTGYTGRGQIRYNFYTTSEAINFTVAIPAPATGVVTLALTDTQTDTLNADRYVYDIEVVSASLEVYRIVEGNVTVTPGVTKPLISSSSSSSGA